MDLKSLLELKFLAPWAPHLLSVLRILSALTFMTHGTVKYFSWPTKFPVPLTPLLYAAGALEIVGGILLAIGLFSRPVAFILSGLMAFAYFISHAPRGFFPVVNGGEGALLFCFIFLYIAAAGPGPLSIDAQRRA